MGHAVIRLLFSLILSLSDERSNSDKEQDWLKVGSSIEYAMMITNFSKRHKLHLLIMLLQGLPCVMILHLMVKDDAQ